MKKILLLALTGLIVIKGFSQIKISALPTHTGNPSPGWVPIVVSGATKKIDPKFLAWSLYGNDSTVAGTNFIGTTDAISLVFKVNNATWGRLDMDNGNILFGPGIANTGELNVVLGYETFGSNTTGIYNVSLGSNLAVNTTGSDNIAIGYQALNTNIDGSNNIALGTNAGNGNVSGQYNVFLGANGAGGIQSYNTLLGYGAVAGGGDETVNYSSAIGYGSSVSLPYSLILGDKNANEGLGTNVGIGTTAPYAKFVIKDRSYDSLHYSSYGLHLWNNWDNWDYPRIILTETYSNRDGIIEQTMNGLNYTSDKHSFYGNAYFQTLSTPNTSSYVIGDATTETNAFRLNTTDHYILLDENDINNVGIGTSTPSEKLEVAGNIKSEHLIGRGTTPSIQIIVDPEIMTDGTISVTGTDEAGEITFTPATSSISVRLSFGSEYGTAPYVVFSPANVNAARVINDNKPYVESSTSYFDLKFVNSIASYAGQTLKFNYHVIQ